MEFYSTEKIDEIMAFGGKWIDLEILMIGEEAQIWNEKTAVGFLSYVDLRFNFYIFVYTCLVMQSRS